jgi:CDP-6-deoxy-D-xylo-4-hexulose-3-dehydrase
MPRYKYPCTGKVNSIGFADFLREELTDNRRNIKLLTEELSNLLDVPYVTLVNSGSSANLVAAIAVKELNPKRNKVILSGFSFPTTISAFALLGFDIQLVDTEKDGFNICPEALKLVIDENTAAVCVTHFLGFPAQLAAIREIAHEHGAMIVQDACETMNLLADGKLIYEFGDFITHSFYHPHHLSSYGGGAVVTTDKKLHRITESVSHWGRTCFCHVDPEECTAPSGLNHNFWYERLGVNVEISELNACFARFQLSTWAIQEAKRHEYYTFYFNELSNISEVKVYKSKFNISPFVFPIILPQSQFQIVTQTLINQGVEVRSLMGGAIHKHPAYKHLAHKNLTNCSEIGATGFFVGIHQTLSTKNIKEAATIIKQTLQDYLV